MNEFHKAFSVNEIVNIALQYNNTPWDYGT